MEILLSYNRKLCKNMKWTSLRFTSRLDGCFSKMMTTVLNIKVQYDSEQGPVVYIYFISSFIKQVSYNNVRIYIETSPQW